MILRQTSRPDHSAGSPRNTRTKTQTRELSSSHHTQDDKKREKGGQNPPGNPRGKPPSAKIRQSVYIYNSRGGIKQKESSQSGPNLCTCTCRPIRNRHHNSIYSHLTKPQGSDGPGSGLGHRRCVRAQRAAEERDFHCSAPALQVMFPVSACRFRFSSRRQKIEKRPGGYSTSSREGQRWLSLITFRTRSGAGMGEVKSPKEGLTRTRCPKWTSSVHT